jgi:hypothetical protein
VSSNDDVFHEPITIDALLARLAKVRAGGAAGRWMARCPAHEDGSASLSVGLGDDSRILLHCFAGCVVGDVCAALGLTVAQLFPAARDWNRPYLRPEERGANYTRASVYDALETLDHHAAVVWFAATEMLQSGALTQRTWHALTLAQRTIGNVRAVLKPAKVKP